ncbi:hypothetical protein FRB93_011334 [Tulasnella sp. JGI-2019a]|nr:hypothetical protein FRB93_011334 [Tulasnella sp. JGI-2019a]
MAVTPYSTVGTQASLIKEKFPTSADPDQWDAETASNYPEPDDELYNPKPKRDRHIDHAALFSGRGCLNVGCLVLVTTCLFTLCAGFPIISHYTHISIGTNGGYDLCGDAYTMQSAMNGENYNLVFSDEFNVDGRSFYPGDDPYWEAADLHYWATNNLEWYDPAAVTTKDGSLVITLSKQPSH